MYKGNTVLFMEHNSVQIIKKINSNSTILLIPAAFESSNSGHLKSINSNSGNFEKFKFRNWSLNCSNKIGPNPDTYTIYIVYYMCACIVQYNYVLCLRFWNVFKDVELILGNKTQVDALTILLEDIETLQQLTNAGRQGQLDCM